MKESRRVRIVSGGSGLDSLRGEWQALTDTSAEAPFYLLYEWYWACLHYLEDDPAHAIFAVLEDDSGCRGILPLRRERQRYFKVPLNVWSVPACGDLADLLLSPQERLDAWWPEIKAALATLSFRWTALRIPRVLEQRIAELQADGLRRNALYRPRGYSCYFRINSPYESLSAAYTTRLRKILRKGWSGLAKLGTVQVQTARSAPELASGLADFVRLEASGWKGESGTASALAQDLARGKFCEHVFSGPAAERNAEINLLTLDGQPVAAQLCMVSGGVRSVYKIAHDQSLQKYSPGSLLLDAVLQRSCELRDVRSLSLVTGLGWMREWGADSATVGDLFFFRSRVLAFIVSSILRLKDRLEAGRVATRSDPGTAAAARSPRH